MKHSPKTSREAAVFILSDIIENGAYANIVLRKTLSQTSLLPQDRAFVTELVNETLRNLLFIDNVLNHFSKVPVLKMKPFIRNLLRVSVCQLRNMDKIPESAAVNEAVILAKAAGFAGLSGFVNGVLRAIARQKLSPALPCPGSPDYLSWRYSYPSWLADTLVKWLGREEALVFCQNSHLPPPVTIFANTCIITIDALAKRLQAEGVKCAPFGNDFLILRYTGDISKLAAFRDGLFFVMDPGAIWAVKALSPAPGQTILDLCAAPGGKSFAIACYMGNTGHVRAFDIHQHRVNLIQESVKRLGLFCISPEAKDATVYDPSLNASADMVLLDVPCSGFGTIRKRPEVKYNRQASDIKTLAEKQRQMLSIGARYVKPGGLLVYSTCTISREENIDNILWFLRHHPFEMQQFIPPQSANMHFITENNCIQILSGPTNDGFFIAAMVKNL